MTALIDETTNSICQGHHASVRMTHGTSSRSLPFQNGPRQGFDGIKLTGKDVVLVGHGKLVTVADVRSERCAGAKIPARPRGDVRRQRQRFHGAVPPHDAPGVAA